MSHAMGTRSGAEWAATNGLFELNWSGILKRGRLGWVGLGWVGLGGGREGCAEWIVAYAGVLWSTPSRLIMIEVGVERHAGGLGWSVGPDWRGLEGRHGGGRGVDPMGYTPD